MTCAEEIVSIIKAIEWWHVLVYVPLAGFLWGVASGLAESVIGAVFPATRRP